MAGIVLILAAIAYKKLQTPPAPSGVANETAAREPSNAHHSGAAHEAPTIEPLGSPPPPPASVAEPAPSLADPKDLLAVLTGLDGRTPITATESQQWKQALAELVHEGTAAVPLIHGYLTNNQDVVYPSAGLNSVGYPTLRAGLIDALSQIGGTNALEALTQTLQTTPYPTDLMALSKALDPLGAQYEQEVLGAARQQLQVAGQGQLGDLDVGPLFQILGNEAVNGADIGADLQQAAGRWPYYTAITLANLPDGSGMTELIQMAQASGGSTQNPAADVLAELAGTNPLAQSTLLEMVKDNQVPDWMVARLTPFLGGAQYEVGQDQPPGATGFQTFHVAVGNQDFSFSNPPSMSADQINQRINFIDQLMQALPAGGDAQQALQQERATLAGRLPPPAAK
jgi:hypothetical protein